MNINTSKTNFNIPTYIVNKTVAKKKVVCNQTTFPQGTLQKSLDGLSTISFAGIMPKISKEVSNELSAVFKKGLAYAKDGNLFTGQISKVNSIGEKFNIKIKDGIITQSTKLTSDGKVASIKKYSIDKFQNKIVDIFTPEADGTLKLKNKIIINKDKYIKNIGENTIDQCWFNTPQGFKRIDKYIDKRDIKTNENPIGYYIRNGIQVNSFLRDGEFRSPNDLVGRIPYEILDDPECPDFYKDELRNIMRDNRFIIHEVDELDLLTKTSKTTEPMTVYRNAPYWWVNSAKDGFLTERAFCSTSSVEGASMEGLIFGKHAKDGITYKIKLPEGTPFLDLRHNREKEMLLPRNGRFKIIDNSTLEYILK